MLAPITPADLTNASFRWLTGKEIGVAGVAGVRALRVNYVGELGWELHVPMANMPAVFDALMAAGKPHGIKLFGTYAMNSLRMEKAYRGWGSELTTEIDMIEASMDLGAGRQPTPDGPERNEIIANLRKQFGVPHSYKIPQRGSLMS